MLEFCYVSPRVCYHRLIPLAMALKLVTDRSDLEDKVASKHMYLAFYPWFVYCLALLTFLLSATDGFLYTLGQPLFLKHWSLFAYRKNIFFFFQNRQFFVTSLCLFNCLLFLISAHWFRRKTMLGRQTDFCTQNFHLYHYTSTSNELRAFKLRYWYNFKIPYLVIFFY